MSATVSPVPVKEIVIRHWLMRMFEVYMKLEGGREIYCGAADQDTARSRAKQLAKVHGVIVREVNDAPRA